jgi:hypothetical protein
MSAGEPDGCLGMPNDKPRPMMPAATNGANTAYQATMLKAECLGDAFMLPNVQSSGTAAERDVEKQNDKQIS